MIRMSELTWTCGICQPCLKNSHIEVKMIKEKIISGDIEGKYSKEVYVCPACGFTREI